MGWYALTEESLRDSGTGSFQVAPYHPEKVAGGSGSLAPRIRPPMRWDHYAGGYVGEGGIRRGFAV